MKDDKYRITYIPKDINKHQHDYQENYTLVIKNINKKASGASYNSHDFFNVLKCKYCDSFIAKSDDGNYAGHIFDIKDINHQLPIIYAETMYKNPIYNFNDLKNVLVTKMSNNNVYYIVTLKDDSLDEKTFSLKMLEKISRFLNIKYSDIYYNQYGKPYFEDNVFYFNYSHSKRYFACAISLFDVGIDIEDSSRIINDNVSNRYLDKEEKNINRIEKWVQKEAYSKLKGLGLQIDFAKIDLDSIEEEYKIIKNMDYVCCIYSDCKNPSFKSINLIEER